MNKKTIKYICVFLLCIASAVASAEWMPIDDEDLANVAGQALLTMDKLPGTSGVDSNLTFYRVSVDAQLGFNANIAKMQLGCGGFNQGIQTGCDIDFSDVRFLGAGTGQPASQTYGLQQASTIGNPVTSDFVLTRPYIELAISNDGTPGSRELAGVAIGAETANGAISIGAFDPNGSLGASGTGSSGTCSGANPPASCHTGINSLSGHLVLNLSGTLSGCITVAILCVAYTGNIGTQQPDGSYSQQMVINGTRMTAPALAATAHVTSPISTNVTAVLQDPLTFFHNMVLSNTTDFFMSFERQQIQYPNFSGGGYQSVSNTGWWLNAPNGVSAVANMTGVNMTAGQALGGALGFAQNLGQTYDLGQRPVKNCYGTASFC